MWPVCLQNIEVLLGCLKSCATTIWMTCSICTQKTLLNFGGFPLQFYTWKTALVSFCMMFRSIEGNLNNASKNSYPLGRPSLYMPLVAYWIELVKSAKQNQNVLNYWNVNWKYKGHELVLETKDFLNYEKNILFYLNFDIFILFGFIWCVHLENQLAGVAC